MRTVAIVGRPNVGKSALFNRLVGQRIAIVDAASGVTRDRLYAQVEWQGATFQLVDTGGLALEPDEFEASIARQVQVAVEEADVILFAVVGQAGRTSQDDAVAARLRQANKPAWLIVTKIDNREMENDWTEFACYGFERWFNVSALQGRGIGELLDALTGALAEAPGTDAEAPEAEEKPAETAIAVVGRPNAGKSTLVNRLMGEERCIVSEVPGTTRDAVDVHLTLPGGGADGAARQVMLIDTAGIRLKKSMKTPLDIFAVHRAEKAIGRAQVAILLMDATAGVTTTDKKIAALVAEAGTGCVIGVNKWDLMQGKTDRTAYQQWIRQELPFLAYAPLVLLSALKGDQVGMLLRRACAVAEAAAQRITTGMLNHVLHAAFERSQPPLQQGKRLKFFYGTQVGTLPPRFLLFVNDPRRVQATYTSYVVNELRAAFGLEGTPVVLNWRVRGARNPRK